MHRKSKHDQFDNHNSTCQLHPMYCAHDNENFLNRHDSGMPDCVDLRVENFHTYLYDISPWVSLSFKGFQDGRVDQVEELVFFKFCIFSLVLKL